MIVFRRSALHSILLALCALAWGCSSSDDATDPCTEGATSDPTVVFESNFEFGNARTPFSFDASASEDPDCSTRKLYYRWDTDTDGTIDYPADGSWSENPRLDINLTTVGFHIVTVHVSADPSATSKRISSDVIIVEIVDRDYAAIGTWVGTGLPGRRADGSSLRETELSTPMDITFGPDDTAYITDWQNHQILEVRDGATYRICGTGTLGDAPEGSARNSGLNHPTNVTLDPQGRLILAAWHNSMVMRIDVGSDNFVRVAGIRPDPGTFSNRCFQPLDEGGAAVDACLDLPSSSAFDSDGNLYISDQKNIRVVKVSAVGGEITDHNETGTQSSFETIIGVPCADPGSGAPNCPDGGFNGNDIPATQAYLRAPGLQSADPTSRIVIRDDVLYLADSENNQIRKVDLKVEDPNIELVAGSTTLDAFGRPTRGGALSDVPAIGNPLNRPCDIAVDPDGNIFIADTDNSVVRRVDVNTGMITTIAGSGTANPLCVFNGQCEETDDEAYGDGGDPLAAYIALPYGIDLDSEGNLYIVDTFHHRVRIVYK